MVKTRAQRIDEMLFNASILEELSFKEIDFMELKDIQRELMDVETLQLIIERLSEVKNRIIENNVKFAKETLNVIEEYQEKILEVKSIENKLLKRGLSEEEIKIEKEKVINE